ncbi:hypothetical protein EDD18DRAFT_1113430 [Armillaria luteobubalina]|uniref:Uncharacterized protein n=1 Tax=Armillaria luteobubalina TaxID=153913 RepID=A0AA39PBU0_9AGAR|nr:hypothetical protein EDD18DRAFT_1113430 [Armillaria luteobubalina]
MLAATLAFMYLPTALEAAAVLVLQLSNYEDQNLHNARDRDWPFSCIMRMKSTIYMLALEHTKSDIHRVISEDVIARKFTLNLDCIVLNLVVKNAPQNICAIFMQCQFLGILHYVQSTGAAEFFIGDPRETIIVDAVPDVEIQHATMFLTTLALCFVSRGTFVHSQSVTNISILESCGGTLMGSSIISLEGGTVDGCVVVEEVDRRRVVVNAQAGAYRDSHFHGRRVQDREYDFDKGRKEGVNDGRVHRLSHVDAH